MLTLDTEKRLEAPELTAEMMERLAGYALVGFHVKGYPITDELLSPFAGHKRMVNFGVEDGALTDACFPVFSHMPKLRYLLLDGNADIRGSGLPALQNCKIDLLTLNRTGLDDAGLLCAASLPRLSHIQLDHTSVTYEGLLATAGNARIEPVAHVQFTREQMERFSRIQREKAKKLVRLDEQAAEERNIWITENTFDPGKVAEYRKKMLSAPIRNSKAVLQEMIGQRKEEAEDDDMDWAEEILGKMAGGYDNRRFSSYWNSDSQMTYPLILAKIPVKNPWEIFAYLPFGGWNECPNTPELRAVVKGWFEQHGAMPAVMTHDELELLLPAPVPREKAMDVATELYGFCPDVVDQGPGEATVGTLADALRQSTIWYFWWD